VLNVFLLPTFTTVDAQCMHGAAAFIPVQFIPIS